MKPSSYRKIKNFKKSLLNFYYKLTSPLVWILHKLEDYKYNRLKNKVSVDKVAKLLAKDIYKYFCTSNYDKDSYVIIADWVKGDSYLDPKKSIEYFTKIKSKSRKLSKFLKSKEINEYLFYKVMCEFANLNSYTFVEVVDEFKNDTWDIRGYKYAYHFGIKE